MTAKERLLAQLEELSEQDALNAEIVIKRPKAEQRRREAEEWGEPDTIGLPESWKTFDDGTPQPDWLAALDEVRRGR
jgi:hypothetical protein